MGAGGEKKPLHEIGATKQSARDDAFEAILERVESAGGEITKDETAPLYTEVGSQELEVGEQRIVEFNLNKLDFQLIRKVETHSLQGSGHQKHLEEMSVPRTSMIMKRKLETESQWQIVDLDDLF